MSDKKSWFSIKCEAETATINIHGSIGAWDITSKDFINELAGIKNIGELDVHINSYGGEVFDGIAIYNALKGFPGVVNTYVDGVAASIASVIFMAGSKRVVYNTSMVMVHNPLMMSYGNAAQLRKDADLLDKIDQSTIKKAYKDAVGDAMTEKEIAALMDDETWLDADEAKIYGFATDVQLHNSDSSTNYATAFDGANFESVGFKKVPKAILDIFNKPIAAVAPVEITKPMEAPMSTPEMNLEELAQKATAAERKRISGIQAAASAFAVDQKIIDSAIESGKSVEDAVSEFAAARKVSDAAFSQAGALSVTGARVTITADEKEKFHKCAVDGLCMASGMAIDETSRKAVMQSDGPRDLHSLIRNSLSREGMLSDRAINNLQPSELGRHAVRMAKNAVSVGTGDLTNILADTLNKGVSIGYTQAPTTFQAWARVMPVKDFRDYSLVKMSAFSDMDVIPEGAAFKHGALSDSKETGSVSVKGKALTISMQTLVNDDLGALARIPEYIGSSYAFRQNRDVYDTLYGPAGVGPVMTEVDSGSATACFTALRGNYASGAGAPSVTTLTAARKAMRNMTAPKGEGSDGSRPLNLVPSFIIHGTSLETTTEQLIGTRTDIASAGSLALNPFAIGGRTPLQIIVDAYLETKTSTGWYLAASPAMIETIVVLALNGQLAPTIRSEEARVGEALGISWDIHGAYGVMCGDFRGLYFHAGA